MITVRGDGTDVKVIGLIVQISRLVRRPGHVRGVLDDYRKRRIFRHLYVILGGLLDFQPSKRGGFLAILGAVVRRLNERRKGVDADLYFLWCRG